MLINSCLNAREAMPNGRGRLTVKTRDVLVDSASKPAGEPIQPGPYALLSVSDTGCGMDEYTAARAFEPFFTTKDVDQGPGLGLAIVYGIIKQHQGGI